MSGVSIICNLDRVVRWLFRWIRGPRFFDVGRRKVTCQSPDQGPWRRIFDLTATRDVQDFSPRYNDDTSLPGQRIKLGSR